MKEDDSANRTIEKRRGAKKALEYLSRLYGKHLVNYHRIANEKNWILENIFEKLRFVLLS